MDTPGYDSRSARAAIGAGAPALPPKPPEPAVIDGVFEDANDAIVDDYDDDPAWDDDE